MQNRLKNKKSGGSATADDVRLGQTFINDSGNVITGALPNITKNYVISNLSELPLYLDKGYYGYYISSADVLKIKITNVDDLIAENIKKGVTIFGIQGTYNCGLADTLPNYVGYQVVNPSTSGTSYTFPAGYPTPASAYKMFAKTANISSINLSNLDLSKVIDMSDMFNGSGITSIPNGLAKATKNSSFYYTFANCSNLASNYKLSINCVNTLNFDNVSNTSGMFLKVPANIIAFSGIGTSNFSSIRNMSSMFSSCANLRAVIINSPTAFDTSNVTNMSSIFSSCTSLTSIPPAFSSWSKKSVTDLSSAFYKDTALKTADLDLSEAINLTDISRIFQGCTSLTNCSIQVALNSGEPDETTYFENLFFGDTELISVDFSKFYIYPQYQYQMSQMFSNCTSMTFCNISGIDFSGVINYSAYTSNHDLFGNVKNCTIIVKDTATKAWFDAGKTAGYIDSTNTFIALPVSGDLITMDLGTTAAAGTNNLYRVLSIDGNIAKVVAMYDYDTSVVFNSSSSTTTFSDGSTGQKYEGSSLDTVLNTTFYEAMNDTAKAAIISQTITQSIATRTTTASTSYDLSIIATSGVTYYYTVAGSVSVGERYVYTLDIQDLAEYKKDFGNYELCQMFYNQNTAAPSPWLRSPSKGYTNYVWTVNASSGYVSDRKCNTGYAARPAFVIDLAKVSWSYNS